MVDAARALRMCKETQRETCVSEVTFSWDPIEEPWRSEVEHVLLSRLSILFHPFNVKGLHVPPRRYFVLLACRLCFLGTLVSETFKHHHKEDSLCRQR